MPPMPHSIMLRPISVAAVPPVMPVFCSIWRWMVGSQIWLVQMTSNVPMQNSTPTKML
jgi:hypothetical protein